jgi:hypothetical protein
MSIPNKLELAGKRMIVVRTALKACLTRQGEAHPSETYLGALSNVPDFQMQHAGGDQEWFSHASTNTVVQIESQKVTIYLPDDSISFYANSVAEYLREALETNIRLVRKDDENGARNIQAATFKKPGTIRQYMLAVYEFPVVEDFDTKKQVPGTHVTLVFKLSPFD